LRRDEAWKLALALIQRVYSSELQHSRWRNERYAEEAKEWKQELGEENVPILKMPICQPRTVDADNKFVYNELLVDETPEENFENTIERAGKMLKREEWESAPEIPELTDFLDYIMRSPNLKILEQTKIRLAVENFIIDVLSTIKLHSSTLPEYGKQNARKFFDKLYDDLFSDYLTLTILIPVFRLEIAGSELKLPKGLVLRRLAQYELFDDYYLFPRKKSIPYRSLSSAIEIRRKFRSKRNGFEPYSLLSDSDIDSAVDTITLLGLFDTATVCSTAILIVNPYYEREPIVSIPFEYNLSETEVALEIDKDKRKRLASFLVELFKTASLIRTDTRLKAALDFYQKAFGNLPFEHQLLSYIIAWEVLMGSSGKDTAQWVSLRATRLLNSLTSEKPNSVLNNIRRGFSARNSFLHNGVIEPETKKALQKCNSEMLGYLRKAIVCTAILLQASDYDTLMASIDNAVKSISVVSSSPKNLRIRKKLLSSGF
jgi:hypothetical protein